MPNSPNNFIGENNNCNRNDGAQPKLRLIHNFESNCINPNPWEIVIDDHHERHKQRVGQKI